MGLFFNIKDLMSLNEVEVDGQDQAAGDDTGSTDYTADDNAGGDNTDDQSNNDNTTDASDTNNDNGDDSTSDGGDDTTDYTDMGDDDSGGGDDDNNDTDTGGSDTDSGDNSEEPVDDLKKQEEEIYNNLSNEELDIKHKELKTQYLNMYDTVSDILARVGDINISEENVPTVEYITTTLSNLQAMLVDYLNNNYSIKSYTENLINYNRFLTVLNGINKILDEINNKNQENKDNITSL